MCISHTPPLRPGSMDEEFLLSELADLSIEIEYVERVDSFIQRRRAELLGPHGQIPISAVQEVWRPRNLNEDTSSDIGGESQRGDLPNHTSDQPIDPPPRTLQEASQQSRTSVVSNQARNHFFALNMEIDERDEPTPADAVSIEGEIMMDDRMIRESGKDPDLSERRDSVPAADRLDTVSQLEIQDSEAESMLDENQRSSGSAEPNISTAGGLTDGGSKSLTVVNVEMARVDEASPDATADVAVDAEAITTATGPDAVSITSNDKKTPAEIKGFQSSKEVSRGRMHQKVQCPVWTMDNRCIACFQMDGQLIASPTTQ